MVSGGNRPSRSGTLLDKAGIASIAHRLGLPTGRTSLWHAWTERLPRALGISLCLLPADPDYAGRIRAAQIAAIVRLTPPAMIASCLNAIILLLTLGRAGSLPVALLIWFLVLCALAVYYARAWAKRGTHGPDRPASPRAIRRAIIHGALFGALWGAVPVLVFPGAPSPIQLVIGCLSAGMMCAGGFVLATVPLAGCCYVGMILGGSIYALLYDGTLIHLGLTALLIVYAAVVVTNLTWNGQLFVDHFLAEARLRQEVTARERAQAQMAHAHRMTALGELAGGIAHDFNNILQVVEGNAELIADRAEDAQKVRRLSARILEAAGRGGSLSRRLLAFARRDALSAEPLDAAALFNSLADLLRHTLGSRVVLRAEAMPDLPRLAADKAQLETVLVNLASNARDAMPDGGSLTLGADSDAVAQDRDDPPLKAGRYIRISMADTGTGMDAATLARATEPFFTTKPKGKGTGLGLSMAKGFAEQSGGAFAITSQPGLGTTVTLWLPQTDAPLAVTPGRAAVPARPPDSMGRRHVLVVDDDDAVRETLTLSLADAGFVVAGAEDGPAALEYIDSGAMMDVLVTDFSMPGINGIELIRAAQDRRPGLPAILLTGHVGDVAAWHSDEAQDRQFTPFTLLQKPIQSAHLAEHIAAALAARPAL